MPGPGRPENPVDPDAPFAEFATNLRILRRQAQLTYHEMAGRAFASKTALWEAASGNRLPAWETTKTYVEACGGNVDEWHQRWLAEVRRPASTETPEQDHHATS